MSNILAWTNLSELKINVFLEETQFEMANTKYAFYGHKGLLLIRYDVTTELDAAALSGLILLFEFVG